MNSIITPSHPAGAKTAVDSRITKGPKKPHLSYSQLKTFSQCPLQWWLSRRYAPAFVPAALVFGGGFHAAVEAFYQGRLEGRLSGRMRCLPFSMGIGRTRRSCGACR